MQIRQSWFGTKDLRKTAQFLTVTQFKRLTFILCIQKRGFEYISTTSTDERMQFNNPYPPPYYQVLQLFHLIKCSSTTISIYQKWLDYHGKSSWTHSFEIVYLEPNAVQQPLLTIRFCNCFAWSNAVQQPHRIPKLIGLSQKITPITTFCAKFSDQKCSSATL